MPLTQRQELLLRKVVEGYLELGQPVGSKTIAADPEVDFGSSTIRNELSVLEEVGLLAHPHTSAGRVPTDAGHRYLVDRLLERGDSLPARRLGVSLIRRELDDAMRTTTEALSQVTSLLAVVTSPPPDTATIRHVEVLALQPQVLMVVIITSTGGVSKRILPFEAPVDPGLVAWAGEYLDERLTGMGLGARMLGARLSDPSLGATETRFLAALAPAFAELAASAAQDDVYVEGTARLLADDRVGDLEEITELMQVLERRVSLLSILRDALTEPGVFVRIGEENELPALRSLALVAAGYGLPGRPLGTVSVIGPVRMDYSAVITDVRGAAVELSRFVTDVYTES